MVKEMVEKISGIISKQFIIETGSKIDEEVIEEIVRYSLDFVIKTSTKS